MNTRKLVFLFSFFIFISLFSYNAYAHSQVFTDFKVCAPGYIQGNVPTTQVPDYTYTSDGFLELHFHLNTTQWKFNYTRLISYDANCNVLETSPYDYFYAQRKPDYMPWPAVTYLIIRYGYSIDISDEYEPFFYNGDTGEQLPYNADFVYLWGRTMYNYPVLYPIHRLVFGYKTDSDVYAETGDLFSTPALPIRIPPPLSGSSNVLFLPGIMGSRLYEAGLNCGPDITGSGCGDKELWVSTTDSGQADLALDANGKSINNIYTKDDTQKLDGDGDETGIVDDVYGSNMYQSFIADLKKWKDDDKIIKDYAFIPYDWRISLNDVITNGASSNGNLSYNIPQNFSESFILKKLGELQATSKSGKVTIIAHSNGGLVAKALVQKLKDTNNPLYDKIDKIIFVAVPQVGTPDAVINLLHGSEIGPFGFIMGADRSRQLSENMSSVYSLLPSAGYFTTVDPAFAVDKIASFEDTSLFSSQISQYGLSVSDETELKNYILGTDSRTKPSLSDTVHPNIGNSALYTQAENIHQILDSWQPSPNTKVIQVAGWGEETTAGLDYKSYTKNIFGDQEISYKPRKVIDGDGIVVVPSALWMSTTPNVEKWWVDLIQEGNPIINRVHRDILEISNLRNFIKSKIMDSAFSDPDNIIVDNTSTLVSNNVRLHYTLHSPLTLGITDSQGRYTGEDPVTKEIKQEIPGVNYEKIGDVQFISIPTGTAYTLKMQGYQDGNFSLDVDKQEGNTITDTTSFQGIPSSTSTLATMDIAPSFEVSNSTLKIDENADDIIDKTFKATPNGATIYGKIPPELQVSFDIKTKNVVLSAQDTVYPNPSIVTTSTSTTLADTGGNITIIPFTAYRENSTTLKFSYSQIIRNGITTIVPNTNILYDWAESKGVLTGLNTKVTIRGVEKYVFSYRKASNVTIIKEQTSTGTITTTKPGFVVVTVKTFRDGLEVNY